MKEIKYSVSILAADFGKLNDEVKKVAGADMLHIDVMDGHFVPALTFGWGVVRWIKTKLPLDVHLMVTNPEEYVDQFCELNVNNITVHVESAGSRLGRIIAKIKKKGIKVGVTLNPSTPISRIEKVIDKVDYVMVMTVHPGKFGQKMLKSGLVKVKQLRKKYPLLDIMVDGGMHKDTIHEAITAGANIIVASSAVFNGRPKKALKELKKCAQYACKNQKNPPNSRLPPTKISGMICDCF